MESALKQTTILWAAMLVAALLYAFIPELVKPTVRPVNPAILMVFGAVLVMNLAVAVVLRRIYVTRSEEVLRTNPNDGAAISRWRQGQIASFAVAESIVLFGLVLRFLGAATSQALLWYAVGIVTMLVFKPKAVT